MVFIAPHGEMSTGLMGGAHRVEEGKAGRGQNQREA